jgi:hypothetical protein
MALNKDWRNNTIAVPDTTTPMSAEALEDLEARADAEIIAKIAAIARSSGSAAAASDALRRLGVTAFDAAAGNDPRIPTQAENDALVGTSGVVGAANRYVTNSDTRLSGVFQPRQVKVFRSSVQPIANATVVTIAWTAESSDLPAGSNQHDNVTNNPRLTCIEAGLYDITLATDWAINATGQRNAYIRLNGTTMIAVDERVAIGAGSASLSPPPTRLVVGDYVEALAYQSSGGTLDFVGTYGFGWVRAGA